MNFALRILRMLDKKTNGHVVCISTDIIGPSDDNSGQDHYQFLFFSQTPPVKSNGTFLSCSGKAFNLETLSEHPSTKFGWTFF